jgi:hypothetical protein
VGTLYRPLEVGRGADCGIDPVTVRQGRGICLDNNLKTRSVLRSKTLPTADRPQNSDAMRCKRHQSNNS